MLKEKAVTKVVVKEPVLDVKMATDRYAIHLVHWSD